MAIPKDQFVNPYSFSPLSESPARHGSGRADPPGHSGASAHERYSGQLALSWTLATPLLLPAAAEKEGWLSKTNRVRVPGSSVAGAVRSLHEAMFNGCFRVFDEKFLPAYREPVQSDPDLILGLVTNATTGGKPLEIRICDDIAWLDSAWLHSLWPSGAGVPTTGDILQLAGSIDDVDGLDRRAFTTLDSLRLIRRGKEPLGGNEVGERVLIVSSTGARRTLKGKEPNQTPARALWATGRLTDRLVSIDADRDAEMIARFDASAAGTDDLRLLTKNEPDGEWRRATQYDNVKWWSDRTPPKMEVVARRAKATGLLFVGDPVWIRYDVGGDRITEIKLASVWRRAGRGSAGKRLPEHLHPCDPGLDQGMCLSCATFGAIDPSGVLHRQVSYAGHVRFSAARGAATEIEQIDLAPLGVPRPGNGMFYLEEYPESPSGRIDIDWERDDPVATHWGSWSEDGQQRLGGRKFYWHSDPGGQAVALGQALGRAVPPRYEATNKQMRSKMARKAKLVPAGTKLTSMVAFDQLDVVALHALLAALEPERFLGGVRPGARFATHLGGGKPFGLGSVQATIDRARSHVTTLAGRYGEAAAKSVDVLDQAAPEEAIKQRIGGSDAGVLNSLAVLLDLDGLGDDASIVSYPPGADWDSYQNPAAEGGQTKADGFTASHFFFGVVNGAKLQTRTNEWHPLPRPTEASALPIAPKRNR